jgi:anti-anti-sigma factor
MPVSRVALHGDLDMAAEHDVWSMVDSLVGERPRQVQLDLVDVPFVDGFGARLLRDAVAACGQAGIEVRLTGVSPQARRAIDLIGASATLTSGPGSSWPAD